MILPAFLYVAQASKLPHPDESKALPACAESEGNDRPTLAKKLTLPMNYEELARETELTYD